MLVTYTSGGQMSKGQAYTLVGYTCGGQISKGNSNTLVAYNCAQYYNVSLMTHYFGEKDRK